MNLLNCIQSRATATCAVAFLIGLAFIFGCQQTEVLDLSINNVSFKSPARDDTQPSSEKREKEEDLLKEMEKPQFALFITGRQFGYIEPCGCTGLFNQKGGLMRRHRVLQLLQKRGWDIIPIDAGNQIRRFGQQPVIKLQHTLNGLTKVMNYAAIGFGPNDLKTPTIDLLQTVSNVADESGPFVSANVDLMGAGLQKQFMLIEKGGKKIGITHVLDNEIIESLKSNDELILKPMEDALNEVIPQLANCDLKVLMLRTEKLEIAESVANKFPHFDTLIHTTSAGEPEKLPVKIQVGNHTTSMLQVGTKGMYVGLAGFYDQGGKMKMKYERIPLDGRFTDSKSMERVFESYQNELKVLYTSGRLTDIKPRKHPSGFKFVGSQVCFDCHADEFEIWEDGTEGDGGPHFIATDDIVKPPNHRGNIARHFDPECISCHATGWHPQDMYPYETGFLNLKKDADLHGNGCENCHGPGSEHVRVEQANENGNGIDENRMEQLRLAMRLTLEEAKNEHCGQCHDADNSPDFLKEGAFDEYWEKIEH
ncbi:MAG: multiheme c-type cytochrome [Planctomycetota bacterium]